MDEKKKGAFLEATRKLIKSGTPEDNIITSLKELGLKEEEAVEILAKAKLAEAKSPEEKKTGFWGTKEEGMLTKSDKEDAAEEKSSQEQEKAKEEYRGKSFIDNFLKKDAPEKKGEKEAKPKKKGGFIPKLRTGGRAGIKEIMVESPLGADKKTAKKTGGTTVQVEKDALEAEMEKMEKTLDWKPDKKAKTKEALEKTTFGKEEEAPLKAPETRKETGTSIGGFGSSLDLLESKVEKGEELEQATQEIEEEKTRKKTEKDSTITILIIPNKEYSTGISSLITKMSTNYSKIVYVNLNELYTSLIRHLKNLNLNLNNFFFVDAITLTSDKTSKKHDNCIFISSPNALIELSLAITQALNTENPDALVFDSLSTLLIYEKDTTVTKFIHSLIGKIKAAGIDAYFTSLEGDAQNESIKDLSMFVDKVSTLTEFELAEMGLPIESRGPGRISSISSIAAPSLNALMSEFTKQEPVPGKAMQNVQQNKMLTREMEDMKRRLSELGKNREVADSLAELRGKIGKIDELKSLQEQVKGISDKLGKKEEPHIDRELLNQIGRLEKKIDETQKRGPQKKEMQRENLELKESMKVLRGQIGKIEKLTTLQEEVQKLSKKVEAKQERPVDNGMVSQITRLANKIDSLEQKVSKKLSEKKKVKEKKEPDLKKKLEAYKKQVELQSMFNDFYKTDVTKVDPEKGITKDVETGLERKKKFLDTAYQRGLVPQKVYSTGKKRIDEEKKRLKHGAEVHSLEGKLDALNDAFDSGVISKGSYVKGKARIEKLLKN